MKKTLALLVLVACGGAPDDPTLVPDPTVTHPIPAGPAIEPAPRTFTTSHMPSALAPATFAKTVAETH